ncbi:chromodomain-helicase-DNA-binding protein [Cladophialophora carrionii]|uniref:Chromodomain-helicase-DNA-binding protein n=1 Tax=Cladophialophora carrionii TaxID=86049 RepID=A0A1C1CWF2_9EURO|nr:chromodomain-helicase-DNA-binding protein [Cladophialophora carrionii]
MSGTDLSEWVGKPPENSRKPGGPEVSAEDSIEAVVQRPVNGEDIEVKEFEDDTSFAPDEQAGPSHSDESDGGDILHDHEITNTKPHRGRVRSSDTSPSDQDATEVDYDEERPLVGLFQKRFYIDVPRLADEVKETYDYLPGHFVVERVLSQRKDKRYIVRLESGERDITGTCPLILSHICDCSFSASFTVLPAFLFQSPHLSFHPFLGATCSLVTINESLTLPAAQLSARRIHELHNGYDALRAFEDSQPQARRPFQRNPAMVDWNTVSLTDSEGESPPGPRRKSPDDSDAEPGESEEISERDEEDGALDEDARNGRRSARLSKLRKTARLKQELDDLQGETRGRLRRSARGTRGRSTLRPQRESTRGSIRPQRRSRMRDESSPEADVAMPARRSERTRTQPKRSMRERQEDEISSYEDEKSAPKVISTKEHFVKVPDHDPFRRRHRQECETCYFRGDDQAKGPLVFCQGCTNSYHKKCLGFRGTRDHLVTKVGEQLFVLQCRRCIGLAQDKERTAPHQGRCTSCREYGELSKPLRGRLTTRQEQLQREENGGTDPITIVESRLINNPSLVMFRCSQCARAWHMHHLPRRQTAHSLDDEDESTLDEAHLAQKRFEHYHRSWVCKDCIENQHQIDALVAWRPVNLDSYHPGTVVTELPEDEKEYLVKWRTQSYFRTTWMPGGWVWGIAPGNMRMSFLKKPENQLPKIATTDAIPEEVFRVDIVFAVRYSSVVRNSTKEIDLARAKEVDSAFVKYKGLGYEDAIWEKPPPPTDIDRWNDFKAAYEDYVMKLHIAIPPQSTLRRHLTHIRTLDFEKSVMKKNQPTSMVGGELMRYQLDGLNWLLCKWHLNQNAILADEMGLGKTIQLVSFFATLVQDHKCWPFLVVVPNSTCPNWRREIKKWAPSLRVVTYYGSARARKLTHDYELFPKDKEEDPNTPPKRKDREVKDIKAHIVVASYESIVEEKTRMSLMKVPWQALVVDEGQRLKSDRTQIYEILSKFRFPFKVLLTGTPLQNSARELFNLLQFLDKSMNAAELEAKYANLTQENVPELHDMLRKFFLRRTKAQVLTFLPPMAQIIVPVTMSTLQKKVYKSILAKNPELMKSILARDGTANQKEKHNLNNILMQLRKCLCHPFVYSRDIEERGAEGAASFRNLVDASSKLQLLTIMLPKLQERGHRVLIFSQFLDNLDIVEDFLDGLGMQHRRIDGTISAAEKQKRIDEFNAPDSQYFAFLLSTRAGGVGINLATADTVIILDPDFNPHQDIQALSRAHRIGQKHKVLVFQLMTRESVEEKIMQIGRKKMALDHVLIEQMDKEEDAGGNLETILRHGAQALFEDDPGVQDIVYDDVSVDRLLDRSQIEDTKIDTEKSAESQFSFARIWANDKSALQEDLPDRTANNTPNPGIWDKILQERERVFAEEQARKAQAFGRGKRKRQTVDYRLGDRDGEKAEPEPAEADVAPGDPDYRAREQSDDDGATETDGATESDLEPMAKRKVQGRKFKSSPRKAA